MSGELSGALQPRFRIRRRAAPRTRKLDAFGERANQPITQLRADTSPVEGQVVVGSNQSCQLEITSISVGTSLAWQLTPNT